MDRGERDEKGLQRLPGQGGRGAGLVSVLAAFSFSPYLPPSPHPQKGFQLERGVLLAEGLLLWLLGQGTWARYRW